MYEDVIILSLNGPTPRKECEKWQKELTQAAATMGWTVTSGDGFSNCGRRFYAVKFQCEYCEGMGL